MTARDAAALGRMANTSATSTANAATSKSVDGYGNASERDDRDQDDRSVQLDISHGNLPSGIGLTLTSTIQHPPECAIRSPSIGVDGRTSS
jgi:hypothetical protein